MILHTILNKKSINTILVESNIVFRSLKLQLGPDILARDILARYFIRETFWYVHLSAPWMFWLMDWD